MCNFPTGPCQVCAQKPGSGGAHVRVHSSAKPHLGSLRAAIRPLARLSRATPAGHCGHHSSLRPAFPPCCLPTALCAASAAWRILRSLTGPSSRLSSPKRPREGAVSTKSRPSLPSSALSGPGLPPPGAQVLSSPKGPHTALSSSSRLPYSSRKAFSLLQQADSIVPQDLCMAAPSTWAAFP